MPRFRTIEPVTAISHLRANASWDGFSPGEDSQTAAYNPPPGWVVLDTQVVIHASSNGSRSVSTLAGGLNLVTETIVDNVYKDAIKVVGKYRDKNIKANLETEREERKKDIRKYITNKNTVYAVANAKAHGSAIDRKRGWDEFSVIARILYIGAPSSAAIKQEVEQAYGIDIDRFSRSLLTEHLENRPLAEDDEELETESRSRVGELLQVVQND